MLVRDPVDRGRLSAALANGARIVFCSDGAEVLHLAAVLPASAAVVDARDADGVPMIGLVVALRTRCPDVPVLLCCDGSPADVCALPILVRAGADAVFDRRVDAIADVAESLRLSRMGHALAQVHARLAATTPAKLRPVIAFSLQHASRPVAAMDIARSTGLTRRGLELLLARHRYPPPRALLSWCRLMIASRLLQDVERSVEAIALELGFDSGAGLRNMLRRYTGLRPSAVREGGGLAVLLAAFERCLAGNATCPSSASTMLEGSRRRALELHPAIASRARPP